MFLLTLFVELLCLPFTIFSSNKEANARERRNADEHQKLMAEYDARRRKDLADRLQAIYRNPELPKQFPDMYGADALERLRIG